MIGHEETHLEEHQSGAHSVFQWNQSSPVGSPEIRDGSKFKVELEARHNIFLVLSPEFCTRVIVHT